MDSARGVAAIFAVCHKICAIVHATQWFAMVEKPLHFSVVSSTIVHLQEVRAKGNSSPQG